MPHFVSNRDETVRLFSNPVLEYFSHIHPATPIIVYVPTAGACAYLGVMHTSALTTVALFLGGVLLWTFFEYVLHRWAFHYEPKTERGRKAHFLVHGIHHDYPRDRTRLVMPLTVSLPLASAIFLAMQYAIGVVAYGLFAGFIFGYVVYDSIHYATHHFTMRAGLGKILKEYHLRHHYTDEHTAYGVSSPLWDVVFGTTPQADRKTSADPAKEASETVRDA
ncbi:MAG: sterol desaturase family protein [Candidatus Kapaibacterium sp.]